MSKLNGKGGSKAYISLCGLVFDVSDSDAFRGGGYAQYPGHDISLAVAKHSLTTEYLNGSIENLPAEDKENLVKFYKMFVQKFEPVGFLQIDDNKKNQ